MSHPALYVRLDHVTNVPSEHVLQHSKNWHVRVCKNRLWSHVTVKFVYYHKRPCLDCCVPTSTVQHLVTGDYQRSHSRVTPVIMLLPCSDRCRGTPCHGQIPHTDLSPIVTTDTDIRCFMHSYCSYSSSMAFQDLHQSIILSKTVNQQDMHHNKWCSPLCQAEKTYISDWNL